ncbi:uncharacterized protein RCC_04931 [Ramularia collo-cygni]|uniref:Uncharacterized protein n=1 Tax=Ramularia collo-cygni TaxID=112498 RepID=A0A2D3UXM3_9PEZI|nr:uncharacterized protein RCC_04931 [Ramularia collo-cygni]CZT19085.1 uncharacterized protein RCC_04931 [Ramularia collo-cygni]
MASQHHFTDRLRARLNDSNAQNLELQALLAQRDDALAACNARLQTAISTSTMPGDPHPLLQNELRIAKEAASAAENQLSQTCVIYNKEQLEWKQSVEKLQQEVAVRDAVLSDANYCLAKEVKRTATVEALEAELTKSQAELKRIKQYAAGIQKQFEAEKKENSKLRQFPATAAGKNRTDVDQDDEEVIDEATRVKQERIGANRRPQTSSAQAAERTSYRHSSTWSHASDAPSLPYHPLRKHMTEPRHSETSRQPRLRTKQRKRKRFDLEDEDGDYDDLEIDMDDSGGRLARKQSKTLVRDREIEHVKQTCDFKAILMYDEDGDKMYLDSKKDLSDVCPELWERIQNQHEAWEQACGEEWRYDLESKYTVSALAKYGAKPPCVTTKLLKISNGKVIWREGCEGKYACRGCVQEKRPCFTWDGEELYLLPLHKDDRTYPEEAGFEIRTWLDIQ